MVRKMKRKPSFFKALDDDCSSTLRLPSAFVQKYGAFLPENAKLRVDSGATWDVQLEWEESGGDQICSFTRGWEIFAMDSDLKAFEFLEFSFNVYDSTFDVTVFGSNFTKREI